MSILTPTSGILIGANAPPAITDKRFCCQLDDTICMFRDLVALNPASIWDLPQVKFLRDMNETFGAVWMLPAFYVDMLDMDPLTPGVTLADVNITNCSNFTTWQGEFIVASSWMKFCFHAYSSPFAYSTNPAPYNPNSMNQSISLARNDLQAADYALVKSEIIRICGAASWNENHHTSHFVGATDAGLDAIAAASTDGLLITTYDKLSWDANVYGSQFDYLYYGAADTVFRAGLYNTLFAKDPDRPATYVVPLFYVDPNIQIGDPEETGEYHVIGRAAPQTVWNSNSMSFLNNVAINTYGNGVIQTSDIPIVPFCCIAHEPYIYAPDSGGSIAAAWMQYFVDVAAILVNFGFVGGFTAGNDLPTPPTTASSPRRRIPGRRIPGRVIR